MEARNDRTGEVIFKDTLESAVAGIVQVQCKGCVHACVHVCMHACVRACVHACMRACISQCMLVLVYDHNVWRAALCVCDLTCVHE